MNNLLDTITNEINQSGGFETTADKIMIEWPEIYGRRIVNELILKLGKPKRIYPPRQSQQDYYQSRKQREMHRLLNKTT